MKTNKINVQGFTLLELLFVIIIAGVITLLGIHLYQIRSETYKVEKTAQQIQQILQAGVSYYIDRKIWPTSTTPSPDFNLYLPFSTSSNPWGNYPYEFHPTPDNFKFQVIAHNISLSAANRIAALLPSAITTCFANTCEVLAEVAAPPTATQELTNYIIKFIGRYTLVLKGGTTTKTIITPTFTCPVGWKAMVKNGFSQLITDTTAKGLWRGICGNIDRMPIFNIYTSNSTCAAESPNTYICSFNITATAIYGSVSGVHCVIDYNSPVGLGIISANAIGYCCKQDPNGDCLPPT
jgi:prepilin-type N-terminal cleavage/methylation domain-containing protein